MEFDLIEIGTLGVTCTPEQRGELKACFYQRLSSAAFRIRGEQPRFVLGCEAYTCPPTRMCTTNIRGAEEACKEERVIFIPGTDSC